MTERLKFMGRLEEQKNRARELELKLDGLRSSIRDLLDPFEEVELLRCEVAAAQAVEMAELQIDLKRCLDEIAAIRRALDR